MSSLPSIFFFFFFKNPPPPEISPLPLPAALPILPLPPRAAPPQAAPAIPKYRLHHGITGARNADDPRRRHDETVKHGQGPRALPLSRAPEHESKESHHEHRLRITRDEKERRRMREDRKRAEEL